MVLNIVKRIIRNIKHSTFYFCKKKWNRWESGNRETTLNLQTISSVPILVFRTLPLRNVPIIYQKAHTSKHGAQTGYFSSPIRTYERREALKNFIKPRLFPRVENFGLNMTAVECNEENVTSCFSRLYTSQPRFLGYYRGGTCIVGGTIFAGKIWRPSRP